MLMTNFLKNRKSVREFRAKTVEINILEDINNYLKEVKEESSQIQLKLYEKGSILYKKLEGLGGYAGVMIESPHYIVLQFLDDSDFTRINGAYEMEKIISRLNGFGLDTCWVSLGQVDEEVKREIFGDHRGRIDYLLAFGHGKRKNPFAEEVFSERLGVEDLVYDGEIGNRIDMDELENRGLGDLFYYIRFAPSALNKQPWRFILEKDRVKLVLRYGQGEEPNLMDAGIIMYYFQTLAGLMGISSEWKLLEEPLVEKDGCIYRYIGEIGL